MSRYKKTGQCVEADAGQWRGHSLIQVTIINSLKLYISDLVLKFETNHVGKKINSKMSAAFVHFTNGLFY